MPNWITRGWGVLALISYALIVISEDIIHGLSWGYWEYLIVVPVAFVFFILQGMVYDRGAFYGGRNYS